MALAIARASPCHIGHILPCIDFCKQFIGLEEDNVGDGERSMKKQKREGLKNKPGLD